MNLTGYSLAMRDDRRTVGIGYHAYPGGNVELCAKFRGAAFGDMEKLAKFFRTLSLGTFGNVGWYGYRRTLHLIAKTKVFAIFEHIVHFDGKATTVFPHIKLFKSQHAILRDFSIKYFRKGVFATGNLQPETGNKIRRG